MFNYDINISSANNAYEIVPAADVYAKDRRLKQLENIEKITHDGLQYMPSNQGPKVEDLKQFLITYREEMRYPHNPGRKFFTKHLLPSTKYQTEVEKTYQRLIGGNIMRLGKDIFSIIFGKCQFSDLPNLAMVSHGMHHAVQNYVKNKFFVEEVKDLKVFVKSKDPVNHLLNCTAMEAFRQLIESHQDPKASKIIFDILKQRDPKSLRLTEEEKKIANNDLIKISQDWHKKEYHPILPYVIPCLHMLGISVLDKKIT